MKLNKTHYHKLLWLYSWLLTAMATQRSTHRQCCRPFSRGAILVLVWSALLHAAQWFGYTSLHLALPGKLKFGFQCTHFALWLLLRTSNKLGGWCLACLDSSQSLISYPVFYNYAHSMLKRIGAGLFLCFVSILINLTLSTVGHLHSNTTHCMFDTNTGSTDTLPIPLYWLIYEWMLWVELDYY